MKFMTSVTSLVFDTFEVKSPSKVPKARDSVNLIFIKMKFHIVSAFWSNFSLKIT